MSFDSDWLCKKPPFAIESVRRELLKKINEISGIRFEQEVLAKRARIPFETLANPEAMERLKSILRWMVDGIRKSGGSPPPGSVPAESVFEGRSALHRDKPGGGGG